MDRPAEVQRFLDQLEPDRREAVGQLRDVIVANLPEGFEETVSDKMLNYCVPHSIYPAGYHCNPKQPLGIGAIANAKAAISLHWMPLYASPEMVAWLEEEFRAAGKKLNMGKACVRLKLGEIPFDVIGRLAARVTVPQWIAVMEGFAKKK